MRAVTLAPAVDKSVPFVVRVSKRKEIHHQTGNNNPSRPSLAYVHGACALFLPSSKSILLLQWGMCLGSQGDVIPIDFTSARSVKLVTAKQVLQFPLRTYKNGAPKSTARTTTTENTTMRSSRAHLRDQGFCGGGVRAR
jgi:hypothetical protein